MLANTVREVDDQAHLHVGTVTEVHESDFDGQRSVAEYGAKVETLATLSMERGPNSRGRPRWSWWRAPTTEATRL